MRVGDHAAPYHCWAGDITYTRTTAGWRYLAVWIDLYSRRVVGWAGPTESQAQGSWRGHAGAGFVGAAPVCWPTPLPLLI